MDLVGMNRVNNSLATYQQYDKSGDVGSKYQRPAVGIKRPAKTRNEQA